MFDTGANVSIIDLKLVKTLNLKIFSKPNDSLDYTTIDSTNKCLGLVSINITLGIITQKCDLYVLQSRVHEILIGLDLIELFKLKMNENFKIYQFFVKNDIIFEEEILSNYSNNFS